MSETWKVANHNGLYQEQSGGNAIYSEFLEQMLRVVYQDDDGYEEFAVGAASAAHLAKKLNADHDAARVLDEAVAALRRIAEPRLNPDSGYWRKTIAEAFFAAHPDLAAEGDPMPKGDQEGGEG